MAATVAIIDYGSGNLRSAEKALARAAQEGATGHDIVVTADPDIVLAAERVVLPGVGAFADCMRGLSAIPGMIAAMEDSVLRRGRPFLGICVGMQLMADWGREHGDHKGLGWIPGEVLKITPAPPAPPPASVFAGEVALAEPRLKIPHMGWNVLVPVRPHALLDAMPDNAEVYFVHSYHLCADNTSHVVAVTDHGGPIAAMVARDNLAGTQFHPEKSQSVGLAVLGRFLRWRP